MHPTDLDLVGLVSTVVGDPSPGARARAISVDADLLERLEIRGDKDRLAQLVNILLTNAITYAPRVGRVTVRLSPRANGSNC
jgi:signal transduction histidine kinase